MTEFPKFYFEGNLYFADVNGIKDLKKIVAAYAENSTMGSRELFEKSKNNPDSEVPYYGLRRECDGPVSLYEFFKRSGYDVEALLKELDDFEELLVALH